MQVEWLRQRGNNALLLFFNGWAMDGRPFAFLTSPYSDESNDGISGEVCSRHCDVVMFSNYADPCVPDLARLIQGYGEVFLCAWSMGVAVAQNLCGRLHLQFSRSLAINGTPCMVNDRYGIPEKIYEKTQENMNEKNLASFYDAMFVGDERERFRRAAPSRGMASLRAELAIMQDLSLTQESLSPEETIYTHAMVCRRDRIVPYRNQCRYWKSLKSRNGSPVIERDEGHFPFYSWSSWDDMLDMVFHIDNSVRGITPLHA